MSVALYTDLDSAPLYFTRRSLLGPRPRYRALPLAPPRVSSNSTIYQVRAVRIDVDAPAVALDPAEEKKYVLKIGTSAAQIEALQHEASCYQGPLKGFKYAPEFLGIYEGWVDDRRAVCLMLEWCGVSDDSDEKQDRVEIRRKTMLAICALHEVAHVEHRNLARQHVIAVDKSVKIVDFAKAIYWHYCLGASPLDQAGHRHRDNQCVELNCAERIFGDFCLPSWHAFVEATHTH